MSKFTFIPLLVCAFGLSLPVSAEKPATLREGWYLSGADSLFGIDIPGAAAHLSGQNSPPLAVPAMMRPL